MEDKAFWYREYKQGRRFIVKIRPEESIIECVTALVTKEKIECAVVLSAIGSVQNVRLKDIKSGARLPISSPRLISHDIEGPLELLGLTGSPEAIADVARRYGVYYAAQTPAAGDAGYSVDHTSVLYLIGPDGSLAGQLPHGTPPAEVAAALRRLLAAS